MLKSISHSALLLAAVALGAAEPAAPELEALPEPPADAAAPTAPAFSDAAIGMKFLDWIEPGSAAYEALRRGAEAAGSQSWLLPRLRRGERVPQASARELVLEILDSPQVPQALKDELKGLLPSEASQFEDHRPQNEAEIARLKPRIEAMEKRLDYVSATMLKNVYDKGSFPAASINFSTGYRDGAGNGLRLGHDATHFASIEATLSGQLPNGSFGVNMGGNFQTPWTGHRTFIGATGANLSLGELQVVYGERSSLNLSSLVYSGVATPNTSVFHDSKADPGTLGLAPVGVGPANELWQLRRIGQPKWWLPFYDIQLIFSQTNQFFETWNANKMYDAAGRFDLSPLQAPFVSEIKPYVSWVNSYNDAAQLHAAGFWPPLGQNNHAYAAGFDMALDNGSTVLAEAGYSDWSRSDVTQTFQDGAFYALATLPLGDFTFAVEASQIGPRFLAGGNKARRSDNGQTGAFFDTLMDDFERQGGTRGVLSYQSNLRDPQAMTNNSRRLALKAEAGSAWLRLGLHAAFSEQIEPSGPWIQSHFILNGLDYNGEGLFYRFGDSYNPMGYNYPASGPPPGDFRLFNQWEFARHTEANAYSNGKAFANGAGGAGKVYWHEVTQLIFHETQTFILLSRGGVGDAEARPDSRKYLGSLRANLNLDFKPLFDRDLPSDLLFSADLRDLSEQAGLPMLTDEHLLSQLIGDLGLRWGLTRDIDFLGTAGYETWLSQQSLFPVRWVIRYGGLGLDFKLDVIMSGMTLDVRADRYEFEDSYFGGRSYSAWGWRVGTGITY